MPVTKEWECAAHGYFDATAPVCPHGCPDKFVRRVFLTPPAIGSEGTKRSDDTLKNLAADYGMTDIKNGQNGESVAMATPASSAPFKTQWNSLGKNFDVKGLGVSPGNALEPFKGILKGPRPSEIIGRYDG